MDDEEKAEAYRAFGDAVNMTPAQIETWLGTEESRAVGWTHEGESESVGHEMGRHIVELRRKKKADLTDEDYERMRKVVGYVHRHCKQGPAEDKEHSRWRYSLMNWGHDPLHA